MNGDASRMSLFHTRLRHEIYLFRTARQDEIPLTKFRVSM